MGVNLLTSGAISKIVTGKCTENDLKPVLKIDLINTSGKQVYLFLLSDGSFWKFGCIPGEILISKKLQKGSIVQLTNFQVAKLVTSNSKGEIVSKSGIQCFDLNVIHTKCGIIGNPKLLPDIETPLVERTAPTIPDEDQIDANSLHVVEPPSSKQKQDHVHSLLNEDIDDSRHVEEPPTSKQKPSTSTQKCSSHSPTRNKKRKLQSSDDIISRFCKDVSKLVSMIVEKTIEDGLGACFKKLGTLEEGVSKLMMEKSKEVDAGFDKLETLEEGVSKLTRMMMEKNKEDNVGACFKMLETLEEDVSKLTRMMMEKHKEVDVGFKKLDTLEEGVSKLTKMMMEKNKEDVVGFKKLETLEENVCIMTRMIMKKNTEVDVGFKKLETLEHVSKLAKMMMEKNKEDDMGACIEKLDKIGWVAQDPMYDTALLLFGQSADYRKLWLHLKPESCGNWVKNAGSMFGLLD